MEDERARSNAFTEEGKLLQAEYAIKNVSEAKTIAGVLCTDGVILAGVKDKNTSNKEKIYQLNKSTYCAVAGIFSDALRLIRFARIASANKEEQIEEVPSVEVLCDLIASKKQRYTHYGGVRPFGVSFLYAGTMGDEYNLFSTDPSGTINKWRAWAFGKGEESINCGFRTVLPEQPCSIEESVPLLLKILMESKESISSSADKMEILIYTKETQRFMEEEEISRNISKVSTTNK
ncbi:20S proteasome subunit alpha 3 [Enteropsectra breve]|nr:20S proteasome subunit alpha 3 [Enteropsectra breve]